MARKPRSIEVPGDVMPEAAPEIAPVTEGREQLAATLAGVETIGGNPVLERRSGWVRTAQGWFKE